MSVCHKSKTELGGTRQSQCRKATLRGAGNDYVADTIKDAPSGGIFTTICEQLRYVISDVSQKRRLDVRAALLQPQSVSSGVSLLFPDFD